MHMAILSRYLTARRGGHERYLQRLIGALVERGCRITAFSGDFDPDFESQTGIECIKVPSIRFPQWLRYQSFNNNAARAVSNYKGTFDLVFTNEYVTFGDIYRAGAGLAKAEAERYGGLMQFLSPKNLVKMRLQEKLMQQPDLKHIIVNSKMMRDEVEQFYGFSKERISVVYNGIDTAQFSPSQREMRRDEMRGRLNLGARDFACLVVGANVRRKGIDRAIKMLSLVPDRNLRLLVVGGEPGRRERSLLPRGENRISFCEHTNEICDYYAAADLCIVASRYDPAPNVILESLACGVPVAVSKECGLAELFADGECGRVFSSTEELAVAVWHFMQIRGGENYEKMQKKASRKGRTFTMQRHVDDIMKVLEDVRAEKAAETEGA